MTSIHRKTNMDIFPALSLSLSFLLTLLFFISFWRQQKRSHFLPPGPAPLPLLGNVSYVSKAAASKHYLQLSKKYGPVFTVWQLTDPVVVLCGYEAVKDALVNHAEEFSGRPRVPAQEMFDKGYSFPNANGQRWRQLRRFSLTLLRSFGMGKQPMEERVQEEAQHLLQAVSGTAGTPFDPMHLLGCAMVNIMSLFLFGQHFQYQDQKLLDLLKVIIQRSSSVHSTFNQLCNMFPGLMYVPFIRRKFLQNNLYLQTFIKEQIDLHRPALDPSSPKDFMDFFLVKMKQISLETPGHVSITQHHPEELAADTSFCEYSLEMTTMSLLVAGTHTSTITLKYCLAVISYFPDIQAQMQQEIDKVIGSLHPPGIKDREAMPYTNAVIHELQRLLDLAPIAHYHAVTQDTQFRGFTIPKGTKVIPFLSSVLYDQSQWETPMEFNPGHFLDDQGQFQAHPAFLVFSAGKRVCPGEGLARMELFILLCSLLQRFSFSRVPGSEPLDSRSLMEKKWALVMSSQLCAIPRSSIAE
ncbi:cytochrome P450 2C20-like isoform X3 [Ascaphus truei]|uniref:cytochrome P450 2C20-like isoform X3 n=1 Tax=Ascaphus truei TaxID=8439 RepID=UPI003F59FDEC